MCRDCGPAHFLCPRELAARLKARQERAKLSRQSKLKEQQAGAAMREAARLHVNQMKMRQERRRAGATPDGAPGAVVTPWGVRDGDAP